MSRRKAARGRKSPLDRVEAVARARWHPVPGDPDSRVPITLEAVAAMEEVLADAADAAEDDTELADLLGVYARTCVWARRESFDGAWATVVGAIVVVAGLLIAGRQGGSAVLAASMVWAAAVPLYMQAAIGRQVDKNAAVVEGHQTGDERFVAWVASGPPLMTPLWLVARALAYGAVAPSLVMREAIKRRRVVPAIAMMGIVAGATLFAVERPLAQDEDPVEGAADPAPTPEPEPVGEPDLVPRVTVGGVELIVGETSTESLPPGVERSSRSLSVMVGVGEEAPDLSSLGEPTSVDDRSAAGCTVVIRTWTGGDKSLRERATHCPGDASTLYEYALR